MDKNQEMQWKETARWIKFEEDVEEETDRWGKPHVASLSFRSLLELRKTISHGTDETGAGAGGGLKAYRSAGLTSLLARPQVQCCWTWTRRPCLALPTKWWSR